MKQEYLKLTSDTMGEPYHFYQVRLFMTTFMEGQEFDHTEKFEPAGTTVSDLFESRQKAVAYYNEVTDGVESGKSSFFKSFAAFKNFKKGENAAISIELDFVEFYSEDNQIIYTISPGGENSDEEELEDSLDTERLVYQSIGGIIGEDGKFYLLPSLNESDE